jgi:hypothetical protein
LVARPDNVCIRLPIRRVTVSQREHRAWLRV